MKTVTVNDSFQTKYSYQLEAVVGKDFQADFEPELTPQQMLELGVFGGKYLNECTDEFPKAWFKNAKLAPLRKDPALNFFEIDASQPLSQWQAKGWIHEQDPRGWFQWYCRYYMGRRSEDDSRQIKRWRAFRRHAGAVKKNCQPYDHDCRRKQRQALLHWAYDSRAM